MTGTLSWKAVSRFTEPDESPGFVLWRDFMRWQRELNTLLRPIGLTQPQFAVLAVCGWMTRNGDDVTQTDVVDFLGLDRMHISQIAGKLEKNGLLYRETAAADLRAKRVVVTDKGKAVLRRAVPIVEAFDKAFFEGRGGPV